MIRKILLVDDDKALRVTFKKGLETYSDTLTVELANDGQEAMEKLKSQDIFLVITDLKMPRVDGFGLLTHIMEHYPEIPVIVITGYGTPQMKKLARQSGAVGYIEKPFMIEDLAKTALIHLRKVSEGGTLHHVSSGMFLQLIEMEEKTCTIRVHDKLSEQFGVLYFREGRLLDAKVGDERGLEAAYTIFSWEDVSLSIQNSCSLDEGPIQGDIQSILLEAMRRKDESKAGEDIAEDDELDEESLDLEDIDSVAAEDFIEDDISTVDYIRIKLRAELGDKSGLNDVYIDNSWDTILSRFQKLGNLLQLGAMNLCYIDQGSKGDLVLIPGDENITVSLKSKFPRDKIIQLLST